MEIQKEGAAAAVPAGVPDERQLAQINELAKGRLRAEEVYVFSVRLCDDQIDRDYERFSAEALRALAPMFVGKTGVIDHNWSADRQIARVFDCTCEVDDGVTYLRAWAYMLRTDKTADVIAEIEGGIRREVSVGCSMGGAVCSVCGAPYGSCEHRKGETYGGKVCCAVLCDPVDAYEFSFVAVPAQPRAGVIKAWRGFEMGKESEEFKALEADAALGRLYVAELRNEFTRLALVLGLGLSGDQLQTIAARMTAGELRTAAEALRKKETELFPPGTQLKGAGWETEREGIGSEFLI